MTKKTEQLDEFKSSAGPSTLTKTPEVADPVSKPDNMNRKADQKGSKDPMQSLPGSKAEAISFVAQHLTNGSKEDAFAIWNQLVSANKAGDATNGGNKKAATTAMKSIATKEDVESIFGNEEISEEFKSKAFTLFEAAVSAKVAVREAELQDEFETRFEEAVEEMMEQLVAKVDEYVNYVAEEWVKQNELQVVSGLRTEMAESFLEGLKNLFEEHYVDVPEESVSVVEALADRVAELEENLNEQMEKNAGLVKKLDEAARESVVNKLSEGLTLSQKEKFLALTEGLDADSVEEFSKKVEVIKESHFAEENKKTLVEDALNGGEPIETDKTAPKEEVDPDVARIAAAMSRLVKK